MAGSDGSRHGCSREAEIPTVAQKLTAAQRRLLREEAADWDRLSDDELARLVEKARPLSVRVRRPFPKVLPITLDESTLNGLKRIARRKQVDVRYLMAMWIAERLAREQADSRPRRMA
jgi:hypothetical protein